MSRVPQVLVPGMPLYVTQRGDNRQDVFFDADRRVYVVLLGEKR